MDGFLAELADKRARWRREREAAEAEERAAFSGECFPCRDTGYAPGVLNQPCPLCPAGRKVAADQQRHRFLAAWAETGITPRCRDFSLESYPDQSSPALRELRRFLATWDQRTGLLLVGSYGTGKTGLLAGALRQIVAAQAQTGAVSRVQFVTSTDLMDALREAMFAQRDEGRPLADRYAAILDRARRVPLLALDDLGAEKQTDFVRERLLAVVNHRYEHQLPTFVTTNYDLDELAARIGPRVAERLIEASVIVEVDGPNLRLGGR